MIMMLTVTTFLTDSYLKRKSEHQSMYCKACKDDFQNSVELYYLFNYYQLKSYLQS